MIRILAFATAGAILAWLTSAHTATPLSVMAGASVIVLGAIAGKLVLRALAELAVR